MTMSGIGRLGRLALLGGAVLLGSTGMAGAQQLRSGSALAGIDWPISSYDWADEPGGQRQGLVEQAASDLGGHCGAIREFNAWNLANEEDPDAVRAGVVQSYADAGWTLTEPAPAVPAVYLARRGSEQLVVWVSLLPDEHALALFTCVLQADPVPAAAIAAASAEQAQQARAQSFLPLRLFGLGFLALAAGILAIGIWQRRRADAAANWTEVPATIVASSITQTTRTDARDNDIADYRPAVTYRYGYDGVEYESKRLQFGASNISEREDAEAIIAQYPVGATITARVNPARPGDATILLKRPGILIHILIAVVIALFAATFMVFPST